MHRQDWLFAFPVADVRTAAEARWDYHDGRVTSWQVELVTAEKQLRTEGLTFREMPVTGGQRMDAVIDHQKSQRVYECREKLNWHQERIKDYRAVIAGLKQMTDDETIELDLDDIAFLGINGTGEED